MTRTTVNIDATILAELKELQKVEKKSLGRLISDLLAGAISRRDERGPPPPFEWAASPGELVVDPLDKEAIYAILDREELREEVDG
jgi:hypothetical protein